MAQLSLVCTKLSKGKFFKNAPKTDYFRVIEQLWALGDGRRSRSEFHAWAQKQWAEVYSKDQSRRELLLSSDGNGQSASQDVRKPGFFTKVSPGEPLPKRPHLDSGPSGSKYVDDPSTPTARQRVPLGQSGQGLVSHQAAHGRISFWTRVIREGCSSSTLE